ncbi:hypothetical protein U9M48_041170 [Paspalum notatum var. saurae]|uniref:Uncharacterized protein n=1 Tax=Paspalum notatum var. saurae TaxID=547442 RepID=A0AAQ3USK4_PASNO
MPWHRVTAKNLLLPGVHHVVHQGDRAPLLVSRSVFHSVAPALAWRTWVEVLAPMGPRREQRPWYGDGVDAEVGAHERQPPVAGAEAARATQAAAATTGRQQARLGLLGRLPWAIAAAALY